jgi:hypothetical protein
MKKQKTQSTLFIRFVAPGIIFLLLVTCILSYAGNLLKTHPARAAGVSAVSAVPPSLPVNISSGVWNVANTPPTTQPNGGFPSTGNRKLLVILARFSDKPPTHTRQQIEDIMNKPGCNGIGSFKDYFLENSYGKLNITSTVTDWLPLPGRALTIIKTRKCFSKTQ